MYATLNGNTAVESTRLSIIGEAHALDKLAKKILYDVDAS
jgi:hypothetical protein